MLSSSIGLADAYFEQAYELTFVYSVPVILN